MVITSAALLIAFLLGAGIVWFVREREIGSTREVAGAERARAAELVVQLSQAQTAGAQSQAAFSGASATVEGLRGELARFQLLLEEEKKRNHELDGALLVAERDRAQACARLGSEREAFELERAGIEKRMLGQFQNLAQEALGKASESFLGLASARLGTEREAAQGDLTARVAEIKGIIDPVQVEFQKFSQAVAALQTTSAQDLGALKNSLQHVVTLQTQLQDAVRTTNEATGHLRNALQNPHVAGSWGEIQLDKIVELAGMAEHCDFDHAGVRSMDGTDERPDMTIHLTGGLHIPLDAKASIKNYLNAAAAPDEAQRAHFLDLSVRDLKGRVNELRVRGYSRIEGYAGMTFLFVPNESMLSAVLPRDASLIEDALRDHIIICSPLLLLCYLQAFANGWRIQKQEENAKEVARRGHMLHDRLRKFFASVGDIGKALTKTVDKFNDSVRKMDNVLVPGRELGRLLGARGELQPADSVDVAVREVRFAEVADHPSALPEASGQ